MLRAPHCDLWHKGDGQKAMSLEEVALVASSVSAVALVLATAWIAIATLRGVGNQMHVQTFTEYTRRYADITEALLWDFASPTCPTKPDELSSDQRERLLRGLRRYFNLCWEELHLYRSGKIDQKTWAIWEAGILDTLRSPCVRACWSALRTEYKYGGLGGEFVSFIDGALAPFDERATPAAPSAEAASGSV